MAKPTNPGNPQNNPQPPVGKTSQDLIDRINDHTDGLTIQIKDVLTGEWRDTWGDRIIIDQDAEYRTKPETLSGWLNVYSNGRTSRLYDEYLKAVGNRNRQGGYIRTAYVYEDAPA